MNKDEILVIKYPFRMTLNRVDFLQKRLLEQKKTGIILLPDYCEIVVAPKDVEIKAEMESKGIWQYDIYHLGNWQHDIPTICSECGHKYTEYICGYEWEETGDLPNFCPHCGVKMRPETDEELKRRREKKE